MTDKESFDQWAVVDVMGHQRYVGRVTEQVIAGTGFVRVDVPTVVRSGRELPGWTKLIGTNSIYAISPVTEEIAKAMVAERNDAPISPYDLPKLTAEQKIAVGKEYLQDVWKEVKAERVDHEEGFRSGFEEDDVPC